MSRGERGIINREGGGWGPTQVEKKRGRGRRACCICIGCERDGCDSERQDKEFRIKDGN
jgi:hypothetical protein